MPTFTKLPQPDLIRMTEGAKILEQDGFGPKVYLLADGNYLKLFRRKRWFSSALLSPHSKRFLTNAAALESLGIPSLKPIGLFRLEDDLWTAVVYSPLPGQTLSQLLRNGEESWSDLLPPLARFINLLHHKGVYFRSLHLGNIVRTPKGELGLIDIADLQMRRRPLSRNLIHRNREHFEKYVRKEKLALPTGELWALCDALRSARDDRESGVRNRG